MKYEGSHFLDHVPPLGRSGKIGALNIKDLPEPIGVTLNIPPFLSDKAQINEEVENTQSVASVCIHVETAISRIKMYKIITLALVSGRVLNQIWTVCCMLLLFHSPIVDQEKYEED